MKRWRVLVVGVALTLLASCASTAARQAERRETEVSQYGNSDTSSTDASTADGTVAADGTLTRNGNTKTTTKQATATTAAAKAKAAAPIEIGIIRTGTSNASSFGVSAGNSVTELDVDNALIAALNQQGGIAGHKIVPVYAATDTGSGSWSADYAAACSAFTEDHHVVAVLGYSFNHDEGFEQCLARKHIPHLSTAVNVPDAKVLAQYPLLVELSTPRIERRSQLKIDGALATGLLTKNSRLGIVTDSCPGTQRAWTDVTRPYLASKGITPASTFSVGCPDGAGDAASAAGQVGALILQFKAARVDVISAFAVSEGPAVLLIAGAAQAQNWHPTYLVSSLADTSVLGNQIVKGQVAQIVGFGWMPVLDVVPDKWPARPAGAQRCIDLLKSKAIRLSSPADYSFALNICEAFFAYQTAVNNAGGRLDGASVVGALQALGSTYLGALSLEGRLTFAPGRPDAPALARQFAWTDGCSCFTYRSYSAPIG